MIAFGTNLTHGTFFGTLFQKVGRNGRDFNSLAFTIGGPRRTPIAITVLVRKPGHQGKAVIQYHDIGDYLSREEKLAIIAKSAASSILP